MTLQASFAATLVDEWVRAGIVDAVVAPGSRSSPLAVALLGDERIRVHVRLDERSAGFFAIGLALVSARPVVVVVTSGTATAELHPAVVEADLAGVPLLVCTADRPPELRHVGAAQTIDQQYLFGRAVRFFADPGVPDVDGRCHWRSFASRLVAEATAGPGGPGPVHANLAFREPLGGTPDDLPPGRPEGRPWHDAIGRIDVPEEAVERLVAEVGPTRRGVIVAGRGAAEGDPGGVLALAAAAGWPALADTLAFPRARQTEVVAAWDLVVKSQAALRALRPEFVLRVGAPPASRAVATWQTALCGAGASSVLVDPHGRFADPDRIAAVVLRASPGALCRRVADALAGRPGGPEGWLARWERAEAVAQDAIEEVLGATDEFSEPAVARGLFARLPAESTLVVSSSMPIRDLDAFARPRVGAPTVLANRGANGIDGVLSTVLGAARGASAVRSGSGGRTFGLLGDLAFFHDLPALVRGRHEDVIDATVVVVDNAGGGIFSFLPYPRDLDAGLFERAFGTPQSPDLSGVAEALGCRVHGASSPAEFAATLDETAFWRGVQLVVVRTDRARNVAVHAALERSVVAAVDGACGEAT
ncbi:MAG TPA: 2-succinyl-5-enolpyruvyl-6-hydroxy-3-cyclohexene-1-carboxylic-acid synthase [Acidimicrobiales bacterium]|nr:2-succinyl-5-enolpyruvyl-6-hydroxy-3-cyclohexene-1-carboxylic-acid synthase [Acidimicrobiales bacterium]